jgi:hypothetical protein
MTATPIPHPLVGIKQSGIVFLHEVIKCIRKWRIQRQDRETLQNIMQ